MKTLSLNFFSKPTKCSFKSLLCNMRPSDPPPRCVAYMCQVKKKKKEKRTGSGLTVWDSDCHRRQSRAFRSHCVTVTSDMRSPSDRKTPPRRPFQRTIVQALNDHFAFSV